MSRDTNIIRYLDINILASSNWCLACLWKRNKMKYFWIFSAFLHDLENNIRACRLRYLNSIIFFIIQVYAIFIMGFAHLTSERSPFNSNAILRSWDIKKFAKPSPKATQMNVSYWSRTFAWAYQWVFIFSWLKAYSTCLLIFCCNWLNLLNNLIFSNNIIKILCFFS